MKKLGFLCFALLMFPLYLSTGQPLTIGGPDVPLEKFINPDGSVTIPADFKGNLDVRGWRMIQGPLGEPRFVREKTSSMPGMQSEIQSVPGDENWANLAGDVDLDGDIYTMVANGQDLYVGGSFRNSGAIKLNGVAHWTGTVWVPVGGGGVAGVDGIVFSLALSGNALFVGGRFATAGGSPAANIAKVDLATNAWSSLGAGLTGDASAHVSSIAILGTDLYAGGSFASAGGSAANNVARWNLGSSSWSTLGAGATNGVNGDVMALAVNAGKVLIGGSFSNAGGVAANNYVEFAPATSIWLPMSNNTAGVQGYVNALAVRKGTVYLGGQLGPQTPDHKIPTGSFAIWDGTTLSYAFSGQGITGPGPDNVVRTITVNGDSVYFGGTFKSSFPASMTDRSAATYYVARFDGLQYTNLSWAPLTAPEVPGRNTNGTDGYVNAMVSIGSDMYIAGSFYYAGGQKRAKIARWNIPSANWFGLKSGPSGTILALGASGKSIYAGGAFSSPDGPSGNLARWDSTRWAVIPATVKGNIYAMAVSGDDIYIGGLFSKADSVSAINIARWNISSKSWHSLGGTGVGGGNLAYVASITVSGNNVYVGGRFTIADVVSAHGIAVFDGTSWSALGSGVNGVVDAIAVDPNGNVYVGGDLNSAGGIPAREVARWDGSSWHTLGGGVNDVVRALALSGKNLYAGGDFTMAESQNSQAIARWDGTAWNAMGTGMSGGLFPSVNSILVASSSVYCAGSFWTSGGIGTNNIARWTGTTWANLGSGTDDQIRSIVLSGTNLYVGGDFNSAGAAPAFKFAEWTAVPNAIKPVDDGGGSRTIALTVGDQIQISDASTISYTVPSTAASAQLKIFDLLGNEVIAMNDLDASPGAHRVQVDVSRFHAGTYFCAVRTGNAVQTTALSVR